jgi:AraC-like DNA-binding protein
VPTERLSMRRIRQVLQLHFGARVSARLIALEVGVGRSTVQDYVARATGANLGWPLPPDLRDRLRIVVAAWSGVIQAWDVDPREPRPDGRHRAQDQAVSD